MKKNGFTLVELLVVISIIGILAGIALVAFRSSQARSRDVQRKSDLKQTANALELFYADYQKYPQASADNNLSACPYIYTSGSGAKCTWGISEFRDVDNAGSTKTTYFKILPKDPSSTQYYLYRVDSAYQKFQLFAYLENTQDQSLIVTPYSCGGGKTCNFGVSSANTSPTDTSW